MKKIAALIALSVVAASANAAPVAVTGTLGTWKSWNAASKAPIPYFAAQAGIDLVQSTVVGVNIAGAPTWAPFSVAVTGTIDSVTGYGTITQVGSSTGYYDIDGDLLITSADAAYGALTFSGLSWTISGAGMVQTAGTASGCLAGVPQCQFTKDGVNTNDHSQTASASVFDFSGIAAGFQTLPRSNGSFTGYGFGAYKTWGATAGLAGSWSGLTYTANAASMTDSGTPSTNAVNKATLTLVAAAPEVPVPAAAWLMGSGLVGLAGIARRRKMA